MMHDYNVSAGGHWDSGDPHTEVCLNQLFRPAAGKPDIRHGRGMFGISNESQFHSKYCLLLQNNSWFYILFNRVD